jgi:hypothetical protein
MPKSNAAQISHGEGPSPLAGQGEKERKHPYRRKKNISLRVRPVPIPVGAHHPPVPNPDVLLQHEFTLGLIAPKGSGKTTLIANLLDFYAGYFNTIVVFSPTLHSDEKWDYVRKRPLLGENIALKKWLEKKNQTMDAVVGRRSVVDNASKQFDPHIPDACFMTEYDEATLAVMMKEQMDMIETIQSMGGTKHLANRLLFIFDDLVGSSLFSSTRASPFKRLNTNHRHHSASILMVSQVSYHLLRPFSKSVAQRRLPAQLLLLSLSM